MPPRSVVVRQPFLLVVVVVVVIILTVVASNAVAGVHGFSMMTMTTATTPSSSSSLATSSSSSSRRSFLSKATTVGTTATVLVGATTALTIPSSYPAQAATTTATTTTSTTTAKPQIYKLPSGIQYALLKDTPKGKGGANFPQPGDIVAIEYTGYLTNGAIFDGTHSEGKQNALLFKLGSTAVIPGVNEMVSEMKVGQKVQAIVPPSEAFGDKGICLDDGECLVKPGSTLVYDIYLKKASIPPP